MKYCWPLRHGPVRYPDAPRPPGARPPAAPRSRPIPVPPHRALGLPSRQPRPRRARRHSARDPAPAVDARCGTWRPADVLGHEPGIERAEPLGRHSLAVRTAKTPGARAAASASIERMRAWACGEYTKTAYVWRANSMSAIYCPCPVRNRRSSLRVTGCPIPKRILPPVPLRTGSLRQDRRYFERPPVPLPVEEHPAGDIGWSAAERFARASPEIISSV